MALARGLVTAALASLVLLRYRARRKRSELSMRLQHRPVRLSAHRVEPGAFALKDLAVFDTGGA